MIRYGGHAAPAGLPLLLLSAVLGLLAIFVWRERRWAAAARSRKANAQIGTVVTTSGSNAANLLEPT